MTGHAQDLLLLEANVDDVTGEVLAHTVEVLMAAGALDAWLVPVLAKKGRPAHVVSVLAEPEKVAGLARALTRETGTLGFRQHQVARYALAREEIEVKVDGEELLVLRESDVLASEERSAPLQSRVRGLCPRRSAARLARGRSGAHGRGSCPSPAPLLTWRAMVVDLDLALAACDLADRLTLSAFRRPSLAVETKADLSPVTEADRDRFFLIRYSFCVTSQALYAVLFA